MINKNLISVLESDKKIKNIFTCPRESCHNFEFVKYVDSTNYEFNLREEITFLLSQLREYISFQKDYNITQEILFLIEESEKCEYDKYQLAYLKILLVLYLSIGQIVEDYNNEYQKIPIDKDGYCCIELYRGQSNFDYNLLPSIYRNLKFNGIIDINKLQNIYSQNGMLSKYGNIFGDYRINYSFISFMQHATEYSPLLDFSKDKNIALVFATHSQGKNYNLYNNCDCSLYKLLLNKEKNVEDLGFGNHNVQFYSTKLKYNSLIFGKPLLFCNISDFEIKYYTCLYPTNDRMKYQQGAFLYLERCVIVNGTVFLPFTQGLITKYRIYSDANKKMMTQKTKQELYKEITQMYPYYDLEHLLNPYLYFSEYNK